MRLNRLKSKVCRAKCEQMVANAMKIELQTKIIKDHIEMPITIDALTRSYTQIPEAYSNYEVARSFWLQ